MGIDSEEIKKRFKNSLTTTAHNHALKCQHLLLDKFVPLEVSTFAFDHTYSNRKAQLSRLERKLV